MPTQKETVFELARTGKLHASHLIPGHQTTASALLDNVSPIDLAVIGKISAGQASDVEAAVAAARASFESGEWSELSPADRKKIMLKWVALLEQHAEELAALAVARGVRVFWGHCFDWDGAPAFWPWVELLRASDTVSAPINTLLEASNDPDVLDNG